MYLRPAHLTDALAYLARSRPAILAGGTQFYSAHIGGPMTGDILDLGAIAELHGIRDETDHWRLGALVTWTELLEAPLARGFDCLTLAARGIGSPQIRNTGTIGGNVCGAAAAADGIPALLALDAELELRSAAGIRILTLADFLRGDGGTARAPDELVSAIRLPKRAGTVRSTFLKLGARRYLATSIVAVAVAVELASTGDIVRAAVAVGACAPTPRRLPDLERELIGRRPAPSLQKIARPGHLAPLTPISDTRATADYRRDAALVLLGRALDEIARE